MNEESSVEEVTFVASIVYSVDVTEIKGKGYTRAIHVSSTGTESPMLFSSADLAEAMKRAAALEGKDSRPYVLFDPDEEIIIPDQLSFWDTCVALYLKATKGWKI